MAPRPAPLPEVLRSLMAERQLTFRALAEATRHADPRDRGYGDSYLNQLATGSAPPTVDAMETLARVFELPPTVFLEYRLAAIRREFDEDSASLATVVENLEALSAWLTEHQDLGISKRLLPLLAAGGELDASRLATAEKQPPSSKPKRKPADGGRARASDLAALPRKRRRRGGNAGAR